MTKQTVVVLTVSLFLGVLIGVLDMIFNFGINLIINKGKGGDMSEANWYVVHTYSGYENKVKIDLLKTIENRNLQDQDPGGVCADASGHGG